MNDGALFTLKTIVRYEPKEGRGSMDRESNDERTFTLFVAGRRPSVEDALATMQKAFDVYKQRFTPSFKPSMPKDYIVLSVERDEREIFG